MRNRGKRLIIILFTIFVLGFGASLVIIFTEKPPAREFAIARNAITEAKAIKADIYSKQLYQQSESLYDSALVYWKKENEKLFMLRNFAKVKDYILLSAELAKKAKNEAVEGTKELKSRLKIMIDSLLDEIDNFQYLFNKLPIPQSMGEAYSSGQLLLSEAKIAYERGNYIICEEKIITSTSYVSKSYQYAKELLSDYFKLYPEWQEQAQLSIKYSGKTKRYAILVDKFSRQCFIYYGGKVQYTFNIELGKNWIGDKRHKGDKATPEGYYQVVDKKEGQQTKYYKALLLNYPNHGDWQRFNSEKKNGFLLKSAEIGGLIEIHGHGGKGIDWTDGCIALMNADMDILYKLAQKGTMVTIIGSLKPLEEILK